MGLFGDKVSKEEKQQKELEEFMNRFQLEDLDEKDMVVLREISNVLIGNTWFKQSMELNGAFSHEQVDTTNLSVLVQQNWMIIRQLSRLNKNIENLIKK